MSAYTVDYFIEKFEALSDDRFCVGMLHDMNGRYCGLGHCVDEDGFPGDEYNAIMEIFPRCDDRFDNHPFAKISDGEDPRYRQSTPKARILAALWDVKAAQQKWEGSTS